MTQNTRVYRLTPRQAATLEATLRTALPASAAWRAVPHASFSVRALGVVLTCYRSGKLVLQGAGLDVVEARFLEGLTGAARAAPPAGRLAGPTVGSDETGKGDYFGPLVVAAAHAVEKDGVWLRELGVTDSKSLGDDRMRSMAGVLEQRLDHEIVALAPASYNRRYGELGNLNLLLAEQHAAALAPLMRRHPDARVIVDRFARESLLVEALRRHDLDGSSVIQEPRAESHAAVAAASILARVAFLEALDRCADACATDLHKGAGPAVDEAGRRVFRIGGLDLLGRVAKLHFKNTGRIAGASR